MLLEEDLNVIVSNLMSPKNEKKTKQNCTIDSVFSEDNA